MLNELPRLLGLGPVIIANLSGSRIEDYAEGAALLSEENADGRGVDMIELNISCPNVKAGGMAFGLCPADAASVTAAVRSRTKKPLIVKLSPNAGDLAGVARACQDAGADALSLVNTFKALAIDLKTQKPVFGNVTAGLSGPAIKPIALRMVWEVADAVDIPLIGMGGISNAGASAVQLGSITFARPRAMTETIVDIENWMRLHGLATLDSLIGAAKPQNESPN
jgi:dihydroorotate dehydrogenase (NAD+) catalytic subunit